METAYARRWVARNDILPVSISRGDAGSVALAHLPRFTATHLNEHGIPLPKDACRLACGVNFEKLFGTLAASFVNKFTWHRHRAGMFALALTNSPSATSMMSSTRRPHDPPHDRCCGLFQNNFQRYPHDIGRCRTTQDDQPENCDFSVTCIVGSDVAGGSWSAQSSSLCGRRQKP